MGIPAERIDAFATATFFTSQEGVIDASLYWRGKAMVAYVTVRFDVDIDVLGLRKKCLEELGPEHTPDLILISHAMLDEMDRAA